VGLGACRKRSMRILLLVFFVIIFFLGCVVVIVVVWDRIISVGCNLNSEVL
jgi:hypothetical protein